MVNQGIAVRALLLDLDIFGQFVQRSFVSDRITVDFQPVEEREPGDHADILDLVVRDSKDGDFLEIFQHADVFDFIVSQAQVVQVIKLFQLGNIPDMVFAKV